MTKKNVLKANYPEVSEKAANNEFKLLLFFSYLFFHFFFFFSCLCESLESVYLRMRERNRCTHRDYQNIAVNGADVVSMNEKVTLTFPKLLIHLYFVVSK